MTGSRSDFHKRAAEQRKRAKQGYVPPGFLESLRKRYFAATRGKRICGWCDRELDVPEGELIDGTGLCAECAGRVI